MIITIFIGGFFLFRNKPRIPEILVENKATPTPDPKAYLYIEPLKNREYPASEILVEETLTPETNYTRHIASYLSDGLKIYGLFTIPISEKPENGYPIIVFLHGYLDPVVYKTTERYVAYQDSLARNGFITFKPDLRGHGKSEGKPINSNFSQEYVIDTLNLMSALKKFPTANPNLIGMWGHSNGGGISMRAMEVSTEIKAAVIWAGVVGSYEDLLANYRSKIPWMNNRNPRMESEEVLDSPDNLVKTYGEPNMNSPFWSKFDPYAFIQDINTPVQLHHGTNDTSVPVEISRHFYEVLKNTGKTVELYEYPGGDHNIASPDFSTAMARTVEFFKKYLQ